MITNINSNINFKGYNGVFSKATIKKDYCMLALGMKLDNEGNNDLEIFNSIRKIILPEARKDDILTITYTDIDGNPTRMFVDSYYILSDSELNNVKQRITKNEFSKLEKITLDMYTFICSLTRRIMNDISMKGDNNLLKYEFLEKLVFSMIPVMKNTKTAVDFVTKGLESEFKPKDASKIINEEIAKRMVRYFL